jgi:hypothetical protein
LETSKEGGHLEGVGIGKEDNIKMDFKVIYSVNYTLESYLCFAAGNIQL